MARSSGLDPGRLLAGVGLDISDLVVPDKWVPVQMGTRRRGGAPAEAGKGGRSAESVATSGAATTGRPTTVSDASAAIVSPAQECAGATRLVIGKDGKTAVATLVERTSRFLILVPLTGRDSLTVGEAIIAATGGLPAQIRRSPTWECEAEMARHATIIATGLPMFFAHPHSRENAAATRTSTAPSASTSPKAWRSAPIPSI